MPMTENGISTTTASGQEQYEYFTLGKHTGRRLAGQKRCQHDYRRTDSELFSCVAPSLEAARAKRDKWLTRKAA